MKNVEFFNEFVVTNQMYGRAAGLLTSLKDKLDIGDCDACQPQRTGDNIADVIDVLEVTLMVLYEIASPGAVSELTKRSAQRAKLLISSTADSTSQPPKGGRK